DYHCSTWDNSLSGVLF
nr:immunoglobulin light chain junction region [Macaca mulatta]MOX75022.1 immunoglobulin light chain junction region [Macaca mulatta]